MMILTVFIARVPCLEIERCTVVWVAWWVYSRLPKLASRSSMAQDWFWKGEDSIGDQVKEIYKL